MVASGYAGVAKRLMLTFSERQGMAVSEELLAFGLFGEGNAGSTGKFKAATMNHIIDGGLRAKALKGFCCRDCMHRCSKGVLLDVAELSNGPKLQWKSWNSNFSSHIPGIQRGIC